MPPFRPGSLRSVFRRSDGSCRGLCRAGARAATGDVAGVGNGFVDVFRRQRPSDVPPRLGRALDSPWGVAQVPNKWGKFKGDIVVGNFRDGLMNVFNNKGQAVGQLSDSTGTPLVIQGLWSLEPGVGGNKEQLFFTAGPNDEN